MPAVVIRQRKAFRRKNGLFIYFEGKCHVLFLGKTLYSYSSSGHPDDQLGKRKQAIFDKLKFSLGSKTLGNKEKKLFIHPSSSM